jgi:hypothetical protein
MVEDERCCGTGTCLINAEGFCWCGQQWDGETMCRPGAGVDPVPSAADDAPDVEATS